MPIETGIGDGQVWVRDTPALFGLAQGVVSLTLATTTTLNDRRRDVTVSKRGLFGVSTETHPASEIAEIATDGFFGRGGGYRLILRFTWDGVIWLSSSYWRRGLLEEAETLLQRKLADWRRRAPDDT